MLPSPALENSQSSVALCSGMLPGYVSGVYTHDDCHVDLNRLARYANARMILQPATGLNTQVLAAALNPISDNSVHIRGGHSHVTTACRNCTGCTQSTSILTRDA